MKTILLASLALCLVAFLAGCATASAQKSDASLVQSVLGKMLPGDFAGPVHLEHRNQYFTIVIDAGDVRRVGDKWTWRWLTYERNSHFPLFSGLAWSSTGKVRLGAAPADVGK